MQLIDDIMKSGGKDSFTKEVSIVFNYLSIENGWIVEITTV